MLIKTYRSSWKKAIGLMFRTKAPDYGVLFPFKEEQKVAIHMFFVFFDLDILWIDNNKKLVEYKTLQPFQAHSQKAKYVLEMPASWCKKNNIQKGDSLESYISKQNEKEKI